MKKIGSLKILPSHKIKESMVSIGFECLDRKLFNPERCYDPLGESGVKYARVQTGWAICEKVKGEINFEWLDDIVNNLLDRGILPWFNVGFGNPAYMENVPNKTAVGCVPLYYGEETLEAWLRFAKELAKHFRGRVTHYEIWNESDGDQFWYPKKPDPAEYAKLISITGEAIRSEQPEAKIGACTACSRFDYVERMAKSLRPGELDFYCLHRYTVFPELGWTEQVKEVKRIFERNGHQLKLWMGEGGYPSWFPKGHWMYPRENNNSSERQQAVYQLRNYILDAALGLERTSFFQMADMWECPYEKATSTINKPAAHGILNGLVYTKKQSYYTISRLAVLLSGKIETLDTAYFAYNLVGASRCETVSVQRFSLLKDGKPLYVYYLPTDIQDEEATRTGFCLDIFAHGVEPIKDPVLIDPYTGDVFALDEATVGVGVQAEGLPIAEYPLIICDRSTYEIE